MAFPKAKLVDRDYAYRIALMSLSDRHEKARDIVRAYADGRLVEVEATDRICTAHYTMAGLKDKACDSWAVIVEPQHSECVMVDVVRMEYPDTGIEHPSTVPYIPQEPETVK